MPPKIVLTHWVHPEVIDLLTPHGELVLNQTRQTLAPQDLAQRVSDATALMVFMPDSVDERFLEKAPRLKIIAGALKGYDNFDVAACTRRKIWYTNVPDLLTIPTAELAITLMLALSRNVLPGDRLIRSGAFQGWRPMLYGQGIQDRVIGILGMGAVGKAIARRLAAFDAKLLYVDSQPLDAREEAALNVVATDLDTLLRETDYLIVALPLTDETYHIIDEDALNRMPAGAYLINIGRGSVVDEQAVADALDQSRLAGYAADVFEMEDWALPARPRAICPDLLQADAQTVFTPHLGSAVDDIRRHITLEAARNIIQTLNRQIPQGAVNRV